MIHTSRLIGAGEHTSYTFVAENCEAFTEGDWVVPTDYFGVGVHRSAVSVVSDEKAWHLERELV